MSDPIEELSREVTARARCEAHLKAIDEWAAQAKEKIARQLDYHHGQALTWMAQLKNQTGQNSFTIEADGGLYELKIEKARAIMIRDDKRLIELLGDLVTEDHYTVKTTKSPAWSKIMELVKWRPEQGGRQRAVTVRGEEIADDVLIKDRPPAALKLSVEFIRSDAEILKRPAVL